MEVYVSAGCNTAVHTGVRLLQMNTSRVNEMGKQNKMVEAQPGRGRLIALCGRGEGEDARGPSFFLQLNRTFAGSSLIITENYLLS